MHRPTTEPTPVRMAQSHPSSSVWMDEPMSGPTARWINGWMDATQAGKLFFFLGGKQPPPIGADNAHHRPIFHQLDLFQLNHC